MICLQVSKQKSDRFLRKTKLKIGKIIKLTGHRIDLLIENYESWVELKYKFLIDWKIKNRTVDVRVDYKRTDFVYFSFKVK